MIKLRHPAAVAAIVAFLAGFTGYCTYNPVRCPETGPAGRPSPPVAIFPPAFAPHTLPEPAKAGPND